MKRAEECRKKAEEAEARAETTRDPVPSRLILRSPSSGDSGPNMQSIWNAKASSVGGLFPLSSVRTARRLSSLVVRGTPCAALAESSPATAPRAWE